jgi:sugar phosphate isomerase/epimerase
MLRGRFAPRWRVRRHEPPARYDGERSAIVIGAGLAGAHAAHALARRGWHVQVLERAAHAAAGASALPLTKFASAFADDRHAIGVQLYTVRHQAEKDLPSVLAAIRKIGYDEVETYWNVYTHPAAELRRMITDAGLRVPSGHFDYEGLGGKLDYARELGLKYMVCPMLPKSQQNSLDGFKRAADQFNKWGEQVQKLDMRFAFHNHNYEFHKFGSTTGWDTLLASTDPKLVQLELDCYWVTQAGRNPVEMMRSLGKRVRMLHLKDRKRGFPPSQTLNDAAGHFTEVGNGSIDWKQVLAAAKELEIDHYFVEQDESERPPIESLRISYTNLQRIMSA